MIDVQNKTIDKINVVLIILSLLLAFIIPFKLFLFSYAVLGPLHYLTEIHWLNKKSFFVSQKKWIWVFLIFAIIISIPSLLHLHIFQTINQQPVFQQLNYSITGLTDILLLSIFIFAIGLIFIKRWQYILLFLFLSILSAKLITKYVLFSYILVGLFLPTIIHVYVFTLLFMIMGTLNNKTNFGIIAITLLVVSPFIIYIFDIDPNFYLTTESSYSINTGRNFRFIQYLTDTFDQVKMSQFAPLTFFSVKIQIFTAFCYTYHYLNWFSKTSIIGWHLNISKSKFTIILSLWLAVIVLFWYDYETAYLALFFLAILHIVLEFPLNITSIKVIVKSLYKKH